MAMLNLFQIKFLDRSPSPTLVCRPILGYGLGEWGEDEQTNKMQEKLMTLMFRTNPSDISLPSLFSLHRYNK